MEEKVVLVNEHDEAIGTMEKMEAHKKGLLHRAFSIFIFNENNELLMQQRAFTKYHSGGLWTNTCCSHPRQNETIVEAGKRRLKEEMGIEAELSSRFHFIYKAELENGLIEHELDHVMIGKTDFPPLLNPEEVNACKYMSLSTLEEDLQNNPETYTAWFRIVFERVKNELIATQNA